MKNPWNLINSHQIPLNPMNSHDLSIESTIIKDIQVAREEAELCHRVACALKTRAVRKALETEVPKTRTRGYPRVIQSVDQLSSEW